MHHSSQLCSIQSHNFHTVKAPNIFRRLIAYSVQYQCSISAHDQYAGRIRLYHTQELCKRRRRRALQDDLANNYCEHRGNQLIRTRVIDLNQLQGKQRGYCSGDKATRLQTSKAEVVITPELSAYFRTDSG